MVLPGSDSLTVLDAIDLRMAHAAIHYYVRAHQLSNRPVPPAAWRLVDHLTSTMAANGPDVVVPQPQWMTTRQVAQQLRCSQRHARRIAQRVGIRVGRQWLTPPDALEEP